MALKLNSSKLLPPRMSSSLVKVDKPSIVPKEKKIKVSSIYKISDNSSALSKDVLDDKKIKDFDDINNKLVKIDKLLKSEFLVSKKKTEVKRKEKEKDEYSEAENKLELPKIKGFKLPKMFSLPSLGFFERVKRFFFFTALGWLLPKIIEFLPKLEGFVKIIGGVYQFAEGLFGKLFDGFMSLVKFGGDLKDKTIGFISEITTGDAKGFQDKFNQLENLFNTFVNASIIAGLLSVDIGLAAVDEFNKQRKKQPSGKPPKPGEPRKPAPKVTTGQGGKPGLGKGTRVTTSKKPSLWQRLTGGVKSKFAGVGGKLAKPFSKFAGAAIPGLGAAIGFADARAREKSGDKLGAFLANLSAGLDVFTASVAAAGLIAAATGVGLPGAAALGAVAGVAGTLSMAIDVVILVRDILKAVGLPSFSGGGRVLRKYQTGGVARGGKPVGAPRRTFTPTIKKPQKIKPPKSSPGKDAGGVEKIKKFYSEKKDSSETNQTDTLKNIKAPSLSSILRGEQDQRVEDQFNVLLKSASIFKKDIPLGVGHLMGGTVDALLGEKMDVKLAVSQLSNGIGYIVNSLVQGKVDATVNSLAKDIRGFADGGYVPPSRELKSINEKANFGDMISKVLAPTIEQRVNEVIFNVKKEVQKKEFDDSMEERMEREMRENAPDSGGGGGDGMIPGDAPPEVKAMLEAIAGAEGGWDSVNPGKVVSGLQNMTIAQARDVGMRQRAIEGSGALGKYQLIVDYEGVNVLKQRAESAGLNYERDKFSQENQTKIARMLMASVYPGGEAQLVKDAREDPLRASSKLRGTWPSLPGGTQENVHTSGFLNRYRSAVTRYRSPTPISRGLIRHTGPGGFLQGSSGNGMEDFPRYGVHFHLSPPDQSESGLLKARNVAFQAVKVMLARGSRVFLTNRDVNNPVPTNVSDAELRNLILQEQRAHSKPGRTFGGIDIQEQNPNVGPTHRGLPGSKIAFPFAVGTVRSLAQGGGYGRKAEVIGSGGVVLAHGAEGSTASQIQRLERTQDNPQSRPGQQPSGRLTVEQVRELQVRASNLKPGDKPVVFPGIGSIQMGKDFFGSPKKKYFNRGGKEISQEQFNELMFKYKLPSGMSAVSPQSSPRTGVISYGGQKYFRMGDRYYEELPGRGVNEIPKQIYDLVPRKQSGGIIPSKSNLPIPNSFASYDNPSTRTMIAIQPIVIREQTPVSSRSSISFPNVVTVVNNNNLENYRG